MKKWLGCLCAAAILLGGSASAYDMNTLAGRTLPPNFTYRAVPGQQELRFMGSTIPYTMGQLAVTMQKSNRFFSGYLIMTRLPVEMTGQIRRYFMLNPDQETWNGLIAFNRALLDPESSFRAGIRSVFLGLAEDIVGKERGKAVQVEISEIEPFRRLSSDANYLFTMGGKVTYSVDGLLFPMYTKVYFFLGNGGIETMALLTPDEGKAPLVYGIDDLARAAAKESFLGKTDYEELGVILARHQQYQEQQEKSEKVSPE